MDDAPSPSFVPWTPPFTFAEESDAFEKRWGQEIPKRYYAKVTSFLPKQNVGFYAHGRRWSFYNDQGKEVPGEFKLQSFVHTVSNDDQQRGDMEALDRHAEAMAVKMLAQFLDDFRKNVTEVTEKTGNVTTWNRSKQNVGEVFLEMLKKVDFGVSDSGEPSLPAFFDFPPEFHSQLVAHAANNPSFEAEVEAIKAEKIKEALAREAERKAKYKSAP